MNQDYSFRSPTKEKEVEEERVSYVGPLHKGRGRDEKITGKAKRMVVV